jgi:chromosome segregation ATPase
MVALKEGLKREFLEMLKTDEEFRYAVAGLLGLDTILNELKMFREDFKKYIELEGEIWRENSKRWEENNRRWEENNKRWEDNNRRWEEAYKRLEAIELELKTLREDFNKTSKSFEIKLMALGAR